ncbi:MAG: calcium-binding protein [Chloroflexota bacterium]
MPKVLITIPHYYNPKGDGRYGSTKPNPQPRINAVTQCIRALHTTYAAPQEYWVPAGDRLHPHQANQQSQLQLDIVLCTTQGAHLLDQLPFGEDVYTHHPTTCEPMMLGFECHAVLADHLGEYDFYGYMEDDLVLHDPAFWHKLHQFNASTDDTDVLQPNRFEFIHQFKKNNQATGQKPKTIFKKVYIDFELRDIEALETASYTLNQTDQTISFIHTSNPHSGCFFLNQAKMARWAAQPLFLDRATSYVGPLESAASLGLMRTFRVYKPAPACANYLEIQHYGQVWGHQLAGVRFAS